MIAARQSSLHLQGGAVLDDSIILEMAHVTKEFPGVRALNDVTFKVKTGEIHCLVGENGAGKSTLMKVLTGVHPYGTYTGDIFVDGKIQQFKTVKDSEAQGIAIIYQELALIPDLTVYENIFIGHELKKKNGIIDWNKTIIKAKEILTQVGLNIDPGVTVRSLGVGIQQMIEIAKALSKNVRLLVLDEPTSALSEDECDKLIDLILKLKERGITCIMISHKLSEVMRVADSTTILRDGKTITTIDRANLNENDMIRFMVGREIKNIYPPKIKRDIGEVCLEIKNWSAYDYTASRQLLSDMHITLRKGEIVGLAGLIGAGRSELALSLFGNPRKYKLDGHMFIDGMQVSFKHPKNAIDAGFLYVTEDRKKNGLILGQDIKTNITISSLKQFVRRLVINKNAEVKSAEKFSKDLKVKAPSIATIVGTLSGGNQQKVSLARSLMATPRILILDEPTRGIDVGAKYEIYQLMLQLVEQGISIIMISSELPEILGMSDRIYVVSGGHITGELMSTDATQEKIMRMATLH
ncbi:MAG: sugar ABC transporter ATP-binding protein [Treponema sp.]|nr:sugar ABC transporter ATP-binding protein [Treponema sp.]